VNIRRRVHDGFGNAVALDPSGRVLLAGSTGSADLAVLNAVQPTYRGGTGSPTPSPLVLKLRPSLAGTDGFVAAFDLDAPAPVYSTYFGGSGNDQLTGIAVDPGRSAYVTGATTSLDLRTVNAAQGVFALDLPVRPDILAADPPGA